MNLIKYYGANDFRLLQNVPESIDQLEDDWKYKIQQYREDMKACEESAKVCIINHHFLTLLTTN